MVCEANAVECLDEFTVIKGTARPFLGRKTAEKLNALGVGPESVPNICWIMFTVGTVDVMSTEYRPSIGRYFVDAPRPNIGHMSAVYQSTVGDMSVNCRWHIGQLSVAYQSYVICIGKLLADTSVKYRSSIGQLSAKCRRSVGEVSAKCLRGIGDLKAISADIHIDRLSTDYRPTIHRVSTECRSTVDRVSIDSRSSVDRQSIECRSTVDRVSIECRPLRRPI